MNKKVEELKAELKELNYELENSLSDSEGLGERYIDYLFEMEHDHAQLSYHNVWENFIDGADDDIAEFCEEKQIDMLPEKELYKLLFESSLPEYSNSMRIKDNELVDVIVGETEEELPEYLQDKITELTEEELIEVRKDSEYYLYSDGYLLIGSNYDRWVLVVCLDLLEENYETMMRQKQKQNEEKHDAMIDVNSLPNNVVSMAKFCWEKPEAKEQAIIRSKNKWTNDLSFENIIRRNIATKNRLRKDRENHNMNLATRLRLI